MLDVTLRVIILCWEFPPRTIGKLAEYVKTLASRLVENKVETCVVTFHDHLTGKSEEPEGVKVWRVANPVRTHSGVLTWVLTLNQEVERAVADLYYGANGHIDVLDAHDWHFIPAAVTLKRALDLPFIFSVESLEDQRSRGVGSILSKSIESIEWLGMYEAEMIVAKSEWMRDEISRIYKVPMVKIRVIPPQSETWIQETLRTYRSAAESAVTR